ncbi:porin [Uliginosibacterium sp. H3]|uniref:Porin n=1 Tax=Uliginosibacterium silvisoli TaxID=3114758 RepID=A0ABU6JXJ8_9RHOO|nr:porin [Uliginosibacterium sp. H3]
MQKTLIASAVACLSLSSAQAQTTVTVGGRIDAGYTFTKQSNNDAANGTPGGGKTTETMSDNAMTTSRLLVQAKEDLGSGFGAEVYIDLRFGNFFEGKDGTTGGLNANDRKSLSLTSPIGYLMMGVQNPAGHNYTVAEKPYMSSPKDVNNIQYGVALLRETKLTQRNAELRTAAIPVAATNWALKGSYAIGDNRKSGVSDIAGVGSGDFYSVGFEGAYGSVSNDMERNRPFMSWGYDFNRKGDTNAAAANPTGPSNQNNSIQFSKVFYTIRPIPSVKLGTAYFMYSGYNPSAVAAQGPAFQEKNWSIDAQYTWRDKIVAGAYYSRLNDMGQVRNSGKGYGMAAYYYLSKTLAIGATTTRQDFQRNETITGGKFDGTAPGFIGSSVAKLDKRQSWINIMKDF